jgi:hypothetical protein
MFALLSGRDRASYFSLLCSAVIAWILLVNVLIASCTALSRERRLHSVTFTTLHALMSSVGLVSRTVPVLLVKLFRAALQRSTLRVIVLRLTHNVIVVMR